MQRATQWDGVPRESEPKDCASDTSGIPRAGDEESGDQGQRAEKQAQASKKGRNLQPVDIESEKIPHL